MKVYNSVTVLSLLLLLSNAPLLGKVCCMRTLLFSPHLHATLLTPWAASRAQVSTLHVLAYHRQPRLSSGFWPGGPQCCGDHAQLLRHGLHGMHAAVRCAVR